MAYIAYFYDKKENRFFHVRYLYYTKKEIRAKAKIEYPSCELTSIDKMDGWLQYGKHNINNNCNTSFTNKRLIEITLLHWRVFLRLYGVLTYRMSTCTSLQLAYSTERL